MRTDAPLYQDLASGLADLIRGGTFTAGERLPSVRRTSREHRVSISTVMEAYRRLEDSGLVEARPRSGYFVKTPVLRESRMPATASTSSQPIHIGCAEIFEAVMDAVADPKVVPFGAAVPDDAIVPNAKLASISNAVIRKHGAGAYRYTLTPGRRELRVAVSRRLLTAGIQASPDEIITTHGATEALLLALRATTKPGDLVAVETPTFFGILYLLKDLGLQAIEIPVSPQHGLVVNALEETLRKHRIAACIVQPNFQNPIGGLMPVPEKIRLAALSEKHGFALIEDDLYGDLAHNGERPPSLARFGENVIHCGAVSKTIAPGLRVGWMVPGRYFKAIKRLKNVQCPANATISELVVAEFLEAGGYDRHLRRVRQLYAVQSARMRQAVIGHFPESCRVNDPAGGFVLWVEMPPPFNSEAFAVEALAKRISLVPGSIFSPSCGLRHYFRLSCGFAFGPRTLDAIATLGKIARRMM